MSPAANADSGGFSGWRGGGHDADGSSWAQHLINRLNYPRFAIKLQGGSGGTVGASRQEGGL